MRQRRFQVSRRKDWGKVEAPHPNHVWQSDMTKVWAGPSVGWAYLVSVIDCCTREIVGWDLSLRCRTEEALAALNRAVLEVLPFGSRGTGLTLTTDNGTQFTSARYVETLNQLGITHRRTAYNHPEGNSYIERFHRSLKEEEVWLNEYQNFDQAEVEHRALDRGVQSRPSASRTPRTNPARSSCPVLPKPLLQTRPHVSSLQGCTTGRTRILLGLAARDASENRRRICRRPPKVHRATKQCHGHRGSFSRIIQGRNVQTRHLGFRRRQ